MKLTTYDSSGKVPENVRDQIFEEIEQMTKTVKKQRPNKEQQKAIEEIGDALKLNGFVGEGGGYWSAKRNQTYVSVSIGFDYKLHVRIIYGSIKEGWEDFVLPLEKASVSKICRRL